MTHAIKRLFLAAAFGAFASQATLAACAAPQVPQVAAPRNLPGPRGPLTIVSGDKTHAFEVELADTPAETEMGLMYRTDMAKNHGMIFDFGAPKETGMWMKNCLFPQDMLFLDTDGAILAIAVNARPGSERIISPGIPVRSVLELRGGVVAELGLKPGDKVRHPIFTPAPRNGG
ncbi:MAG: DUF192 domain-containing protein [Alphaproteobacteria bacterium]|nr:DUF192 domain-containing protein [Alphaproteobacteria bacterium]